MKFNFKRFSFFVYISIGVIIYYMLSFLYNYKEGDTLINFPMYLLILLVISFIISFQSDEWFYYTKFKEKIKKNIYIDKTNESNIYKISMEFKTISDLTDDSIIINNLEFLFNSDTNEITNFIRSKWISLNKNERKIIEEYVWEIVNIRYNNNKFFKDIFEFLEKKYKKIFQKDDEINWKIKEYLLR